MFDSRINSFVEVTPVTMYKKVRDVLQHGAFAKPMTFEEMNRRNLATRASNLINGMQRGIESFGLPFDGTIEGGIDGIGMLTSEVAEKNNLLREVGEAWTIGDELSRNILWVKVMTSFRRGRPSALIPEEIEFMTGKSISASSRALVWADLGDLPEFKDKDNIAWYELELQESGAVEVGSKTIGWENGSPVIKPVVHFVLLDKLSRTRLACWQEGDKSIKRYHSWTDTCDLARDSAS